MNARDVVVAVGNKIPGPLAARLCNKSRLANAVRPIANRLVPAKPTVVSIRSGPVQGIHLFIRLRQEKYYWTGSHETLVQEAVVQPLQTGEIFGFWQKPAFAAPFPRTVSWFQDELQRSSAIR